MAAVTHSSAHEPGLSRYLRQAYKVPMLTAEEELALARRWRDHQDKAAADRLVTSHLRLVARIAAGYRGYGLPYAELVSEGSLGLMQAVRRFDPERGFRLATYAMWWIRAAIQEYVLHSSSLVRMGTTATQKKLFFNLRRLKSEMDAVEAGDLRPEHVTKIAETLDVPEHEVISMHQRMASPDHSLNTPVHAESSDEWMDYIVDEADSHDNVLADRDEFTQRKARLAEAIHALDDRQKRILAERWLKDDPVTLDTLAGQFGVSAERVRQIETRALNKLRKVMKVTVANTPARATSHVVPPTPAPMAVPPAQWQPAWHPAVNYAVAADHALVPA